ncbi:MAG: penicillin acylase family protein, partial [Pseudomonadota bacterium]
METTQCTRPETVAMRKQTPSHRIARIGALIALAGVGGCAFFTPLPEPVGVAERLAAFPTEGLALERPVSIRWNDYGVPFVTAETDDDAAYALGMTHAHLRLGQMATLRRAFQGRLAESVGPFAAELDAALRAFDFGRATPEILAGMPGETRRWLNRYVAGVNAYAARMTERPHEMRLLSIDWEPWTAEDSLTVGRMAGIDINWITMLGLMRIEDPALRDAVFDRLAARSERGAASFPAGALGYQLGAFPPPFSEWNDKFRDGVRQFWRGDY